MSRLVGAAYHIQPKHANAAGYASFKKLKPGASAGLLTSNP
jgi:hypothetical protein